MRKQKTFYGRDAWDEATNYITHVRNIFTISSVEITASKYREGWSTKTKVKVEINFK